eukprot:gene27415-55784_t
MDLAAAAAVVFGGPVPLRQLLESVAGLKGRWGCAVTELGVQRRVFERSRGSSCVPGPRRRVGVRWPPAAMQRRIFLL